MPFYALTARYHRENWITNRLSSCVYLIQEQGFFSSEIHDNLIIYF